MHRAKRTKRGTEGNTASASPSRVPPSRSAASPQSRTVRRVAPGHSEAAERLERRSQRLVHVINPPHRAIAKGTVSALRHLGHEDGSDRLAALIKTDGAERHREAAHDVAAGAAELDREAREVGVAGRTVGADGRDAPPALAALDVFARPRTSLQPGRVETEDVRRRIHPGRLQRSGGAADEGLVLLGLGVVADRDALGPGQRPMTKSARSRSISSRAWRTATSGQASMGQTTVSIRRPAICLLTPHNAISMPRMASRPPSAKAPSSSTGMPMGIGSCATATVGRPSARAVTPARNALLIRLSRSLFRCRRIVRPRRPVPSSPLCETQPSASIGWQRLPASVDGRGSDPRVCDRLAAAEAGAEIGGHSLIECGQDGGEGVGPGEQLVEQVVAARSGEACLTTGHGRRLLGVQADAKPRSRDDLEALEHRPCRGCR